jgi:hypothetical protein
VREIWAGFVALGYIVIAVGVLVALLVALLISPLLGGAMLLALGAWITYRIVTAQKRRDEQGLPGLANAAAAFAAAAGTSGLEIGSTTQWTPAQIGARASAFPADEARRLNAAWQRAQAEDASEDRPSAMLLFVRARPRMKTPAPSSRDERDGARDSLSDLFIKVGQLASQPIWDNLVWLPQERRWRGGGPAPDASDNPYADAQRAASDAAQICLLAAWTEPQGLAWLLRPWREVCGGAPAERR